MAKSTRNSGEAWSSADKGMVAKRVDGNYGPGVRSAVWVKAKHWRLTTLVVCGYVATPAGITALLVSTGQGRATGRVELGIRGPLRQALTKTLPRLRTGRSRDAFLVEPCVKVVVRHHGDLAVPETQSCTPSPDRQGNDSPGGPETASPLGCRSGRGRAAHRRGRRRTAQAER